MRGSPEIPPGVSVFLYRLDIYSLFYEYFFTFFDGSGAPGHRYAPKSRESRESRENFREKVVNKNSDPRKS
jgi:hypothetical protein